MSPRSATAARRTPVKRPTVPRGARARAQTVVERLKAEYPAETALVHETPWELLVATILSAQTTDARVNAVTPALFARYPTVHDLAGAPLPQVEEIIRSTGFFRSKSRAIVEMSQDLVERYDGEVPTRMEDLVTLRGVGRKTANVVLGAAFDLPGFAVDTHVKRLTRRLGLTRSADPVQIEKDVTAMVPTEEWSGLSLRLILHGRRVCGARNPRHDLCVLRDICPSADGEPAALRTTASVRTPRAARPPKTPSAAQ
jgi:endonuclease-3